MYIARYFRVGGDRVAGEIVSVLFSPRKKNRHDLFPLQDPDAAALTGAQTVSGTPLFMAPEQAMGDCTLDARADIYAPGAVMYFALTGRSPFAGTNPIAVIAAHINEPVVPPSRHCPDVPEDLERVVLRCLAKKPYGRFSTVKSLGEALAACASANDWGPNRADAWWAVEMQASPIDAPPRTAAAAAAEV